MVYIPWMWFARQTSWNVLVSVEKETAVEHACSPKSVLRNMHAASC